MTSACWACGAVAGVADDIDPERYRRCAECGLLFQPQRSADAVHDLYDGGYFESFPGVEGCYGEQVAERLHEAGVRLRFVRRFARGGRLLEVGAAEGHFLQVARGAGFDVLGVEPAEDAATAARDRAGLPIETGFIEDVDLPGAPFDLCCAWHVLEHIPEPVGSLRRMRESLVPGGHLFLELPNIDSELAKRAGRAWPHLQPEHHVAQYGPRALRAVLERSGFVVELIQTVPFFGYFIRSRRLRPRMIAAHVVESLELGVVPFAGHATKHELLRAVARARG